MKNKFFCSTLALFAVASLTSGEITKEQFFHIKPLIDCLDLGDGSDIITLDIPYPFFNTTVKSTFRIDGCQHVEWMDIECDDSGVTVMTMRVPKLTFEGEYTMSVYTIGKRPTIVESAGTTCFSDVVFTVMMKGCQHHVYSYVGGVDYVNLGSSMLENASKKKEVSNTLNDLKYNMDAYARECFWTAGTFIANSMLAKFKN